MQTTLVHAIQSNKQGHETLTNETQCVGHEESYDSSMSSSLKLLSSAYSDSSSESSEESKYPLVMFKPLLQGIIVNDNNYNIFLCVSLNPIYAEYFLS